MVLHFGREMSLDVHRAEMSPNENLVTELRCLSSQLSNNAKSTLRALSWSSKYVLNLQTTYKQSCSGAFAYGIETISIS